MPDREKVIRAVATCFDSWIDKHRNMGLGLQTVEQMKRDALEMLKGQEPVEVKTMRGPKPFEPWWFACGACGHAIDLEDNYCRECGRAVKWDDRV